MRTHLAVAFRLVLHVLTFVAALLLGSSSGAEGALDALATKLASSDKWKRAEAVEALARIATPAAWQLVLGALADPKGEVADAAQLALVRLDDPAALERLGKQQGLAAKDPLVRARAAELLGRLVVEPPEKLFLRALGDDDAEVRRMGAWSIERRARAGRLAAETRASAQRELARRSRTERDALARARMLHALVALDPEAARAVVEEAAHEREPLLRGAAATLLPAVFGPEPSFEPLALLACDGARSVRALAAGPLGELGTRAAAALLVQRLGAESDERLVLRHVERLQRLSGLKHRRDVRPWNDWLRALPEDWRAQPSLRAEPPIDLAERTVDLAGMPLVSKRLTILIDLSGSIWNVRPDGRTRKDIVDEKLREALESFAPDTRFNLIPFTGKPHPWKEELVPATPSNVRAATRWFEDCHETGSGNFWDAALLALEDPEVDTLVVLFDGEPTGGTRHRLELIAPLFLERNAARAVALDLLLIDAGTHLARAWGELATATGGRWMALDL